MNILLELRGFGGLELKLQFVRDKRDELGIRGFSLSVGNRIPKEPLQGIQVATVPGHFDGVTDRPFHSGRGGLECLCHLGVENLGNGVRGLSSPRRGFQESVICRCIDWFLCSPLHYCFVGLVIMIAKSNFFVKFEGNKHLKKVFSE